MPSSPYPFALAAVLLASCTSEFSERPSDLGNGCTLDSDCAEALVCAFGRCHAGCATSRDCAKGQRCVASGSSPVCQLSENVSCRYTSDCPAPLVCGVDQQCRNECKSAADCLTEQVCVEGTCADKSELDDAGGLLDAPPSDGAPEAAGDAGDAVNEPGDGSAGDGAADGGDPACPAPGAWCEGPRLLSCNGSGPSTTTDCVGVTPVCDPQRGACTVCEAGVATCAGSALSVCADDGSAYTLQEDCGDVAACDAAERRCLSSGHVTDVALGTHYGCALAAGGALRCWGGNWDRQLGDGAEVIRKIAGPVLGVPVADQVSCGSSHTCALVSGGALCWGANDQGQLGRGATSGPAAAAPVATLSGVAELALGDGFTCARMNDATVRCWGTNADGALGLDASVTGKNLPVAVPGVSNATQLVATADGHVACARIGTTGVTCWGGGLPEPTAVPGVASAASVTIETAWGPDFSVFVLDPSGAVSAVSATSGAFGAPGAYATGVQQLSACATHVVALLDDGSVARGAVPPGDTPTPLSTVGLVTPSLLGSLRCGGQASGAHFDCGITKGGVAICWGDSIDSEKGDGSEPSWLYTPVPLPGADGARVLSAGTADTAVLFPDGALVDWGTSGPLANISTPAMLMPWLGSTIAFYRPSPWSSYGDDWLAYVSDTTGKLSLVDSGALSTSSRLAAAGLGVFDDALAGPPGDIGRLKDGRVVVYAADTTANTTGIFGDGTTTAQPGQVAIVPGTLGSTGFAAQRTIDHACILDATGNVLCWGESSHGEVGNGVSGSGAYVATPTKISLGVGVTARSIAVGYDHACVITSQKTVLCWGSADSLQNGSQSMQPFPSLVPGLSSVEGIAAGPAHTCAWTTAGDAYCWGSNFDGQLGYGKDADSASPQKVLGLSEVRAMALAGNRSCALTASGRVWCWGQNTSGIDYDWETPHPVVGIEP